MSDVKRWVPRCLSDDGMVAFGSVPYGTQIPYILHSDYAALEERVAELEDIREALRADVQELEKDRDELRAALRKLVDHVGGYNAKDGSRLIDPLPSPHCLIDEVSLLERLGDLEQTDEGLRWSEVRKPTEEER